MSQEIFIWSSYGDVDVYSLNTIEDYQKLYKKIKEILIECYYIEPIDKRRNLNVDGLTKVVNDADIHTNKFPNSKISFRQAINEILGNLERDDIFGYGTEFSKLKKL